MKGPPWLGKKRLGREISAPAAEKLILDDVTSKLTAAAEVGEAAAVVVVVGGIAVVFASVAVVKKDKHAAKIKAS